MDAYFAMGLLLFSLMIELFRCICDIQLESSDKNHRWAPFPVGSGNGSVHLFLVVVPTFKKTCVDPLISEKELYKSVKS